MKSIKETEGASAPGDSVPLQVGQEKTVHGWSKLTNKIHPIFSPRNFPDIDHEYYMPSLQLASHFLSHVPELQPFIDALVVGNRVVGTTINVKTIYFDEFPREQLELVLDQTAPFRILDLARVRRHLSRIAKNVTFGVPDGTEKSEIGNAGTDQTGGAATRPYRGGKCKTFLVPALWDEADTSIEELTEDEWLLGSLQLAYTLVHEIMHIILHVVRDQSITADDWSVFVPGYKSTEHGFEAEAILFGGIIGKRESDLSTHVVDGKILYVEEWPAKRVWDWYEHISWKCELRDGEQVTKYSDFWHIKNPRDWLRKLHSEELWEDVKRYGVKAMRPDFVGERPMPDIDCEDITPWEEHVAKEEE